MLKIDFKKEMKDLYRASAKAVANVSVPAMNYLMIDGNGSPNTAKSYQDAIQALYALAYGLKFKIKRGATGIDYGVMPLEGLWWVDDLRDLENKDKWNWTMMIMQPRYVTAKLVKETLAENAQKKNLTALSLVRFESLREGKAAQILHLGSYADEKPTIDKLHEFVWGNGYKLRAKHHEIYLSDARKTAPAKLKTILRHPIEKVKT